MATYLIINLVVVLGVIGLDLWVLRTRVVLKKTTWVVMGIMLALTALFDPWIATHPVQYDEARILGFKWFGAPLEDFLYTAAAVLGLGILLAHDHKKQGKDVEEA